MRAKAFNAVSRYRRAVGRDPDEPLTLLEGIVIVTVLSLIGGLCFGVVAV